MQGQKDLKDNQLGLITVKVDTGRLINMVGEYGCVSANVAI